MADIIFDNWLNAIATLGTDWVADTIRAALFDSLTWTPAKSDLFVNSATSSGAVEVAAASYARQLVPGRAVVVDGGAHRILLDGSTIDFGILEAGFNYDTLILYDFVTNDTDSFLICAFALGAQTTDGSNVQAVPNAAGFFKIYQP